MFGFLSRYYKTDEWLCLQNDVLRKQVKEKEDIIRKQGEDLQRLYLMEDNRREEFARSHNPFRMFIPTDTYSKVEIARYVEQMAAAFMVKCKLPPDKVRLVVIPAEITGDASKVYYEMKADG